MALATVVETWGSAPRPVGSHLVVDGDGNFEGHNQVPLTEWDGTPALFAAGAGETMRFRPSRATT